ncbi:hypothetical protein FB451DRAFT_1514195 [Mycena latifolia]|nr:hypothetical protein FB451DRAFT_1514195 [Mycena latifolia]
MSTPRSTSMQPLPQKGEPDNGATCAICGAYLRRNTDLPRHMLTHSKDKHSLMFTCPMDGCGHQTLQKSNLATHIRTHTRAKPHKCPEVLPSGQPCDFSTADPSSLHRHRKRKHGYTPRPKPAPYARAGPYARVRVPRAGSDADAEGDAVSECESEESFGLRAAGGSGARVRAERVGDPEANADADADADAEGDADADGEPDPEMELVLEMPVPSHIENVSSERTAPPPELPALEHPPVPVERPPVPDHSPVFDLELGPPSISLALDPVLANISDTRTAVDATPDARFAVNAQ